MTQFRQHWTKQMQQEVGRRECVGYLPLPKAGMLKHATTVRHRTKPPPSLSAVVTRLFCSCDRHGAHLGRCRGRSQTQQCSTQRGSDIQLCSRHCCPHRSHSPPACRWMDSFTDSADLRSPQKVPFLPKKPEWDRVSATLPHFCTMG